MLRPGLKSVLAFFVEWPQSSHLNCHKSSNSSSSKIYPCLGWLIAPRWTNLRHPQVPFPPLSVSVWASSFLVPLSSSPSLFDPGFLCSSGSVSLSVSPFCWPQEERNIFISLQTMSGAAFYNTFLVVFCASIALSVCIYSIHRLSHPTRTHIQHTHRWLLKIETEINRRRENTCPCFCWGRRSLCGENWHEISICSLLLSVAVLVCVYVCVYCLMGLFNEEHDYYE